MKHPTLASCDGSPKGQDAQQPDRNDDSAICAAETPSPSSQPETVLALTSDEEPVGYVRRAALIALKEMREGHINMWPDRTVATADLVPLYDESLLTALTETKKERDEANRVLGLAVEQAARSAERAMEAFSRAEALQAERDAAHKAADWNMSVVHERDAQIEALQAENEKLAAYKDELLSIAEQVDEESDPFAAWESISLLQERNATLTKRIEEYEREFRSIAALPTQREILLNDLTIDEDAHSYSAIVLRVRALLNTKGESDA